MVHMMMCDDAIIYVCLHKCAMQYLMKYVQYRICPYLVQMELYRGAYTLTMPARHGQLILRHNTTCEDN